jgi:hypothetical protein
MGKIEDISTFEQIEFWAVEIKKTSINYQRYYNSDYSLKYFLFRNILK